jgi:hypothetical protein
VSIRERCGKHNREAVGAGRYLRDCEAALQLT